MACLYLVVGALLPAVHVDPGHEGLRAAWGLVFALACAGQSFTLVAVFLRFTDRPSPVFQNLQANAFGIYIIHYLFVIWTQYGLLQVTLPAAAKAGSVFAVGLGLSWAVTAQLRRIPAIRRFL